jgi:hypothetical protein
MSDILLNYSFEKGVELYECIIQFKLFTRFEVFELLLLEVKHVHGWAELFLVVTALRYQDKVTGVFVVIAHQWYPFLITVILD